MRLMRAMETCRLLERVLRAGKYIVEDSGENMLPRAIMATIIFLVREEKTEWIFGCMRTAGWASMSVATSSPFGGGKALD